MENADQPQKRSWRTWRATIIALLLIGVGVSGATLVWLANRRNDDRPVQLRKSQPIQRPIVIPADAAWLPDSAHVLGVEVHGRFRAYALNAFDKIDEHVVNDLLDGTPVSVAYCPRTGCIKVYTDPSGNQPLAVATGGWVGEPGTGPDGVMLLRIGSSYYCQDTGDALEGWGHFPYAEYHFEHTTWGAWRQAHPDTDVFTGLKRDVNPAPGEKDKKNSQQKSAN